MNKNMNENENKTIEGIIKLITWVNRVIEINVEMLEKITEEIKNEREYSHGWIEKLQGDVDKLKLVNPEICKLKKGNYDAEVDIMESEFEMLPTEIALKNAYERIKELERQSKQIDEKESDWVNEIFG